jgi:hypothetical protein
LEKWKEELQCQLEVHNRDISLGMGSLHLTEYRMGIPRNEEEGNRIGRCTEEKQIKEIMSRGKENSIDIKEKEKRVLSMQTWEREELGSMPRIWMVTLEHREAPYPNWRKRGLWFGVGLKETDTGKGWFPRDYVAEKGIPCAEEIQLERHLINLWRPWAQWEEGGFDCFQWSGGE